VHSSVHVSAEVIVILVEMYGVIQSCQLARDKGFFPSQLTDFLLLFHGYHESNID
jgi:hypothetical protein